MMWVTVESLEDFSLFEKFSTTHTHTIRLITEMKKDILAIVHTKFDNKQFFSRCCRSRCVVSSSSILLLQTFVQTMLFGKVFVSFAAAHISIAVMAVTKNNRISEIVDKSLKYTDASTNTSPHI